MDAEKSKKLQQYANIIAEQAKEEERSGKIDDAVKHYLKLVDVFLLLAAEAQDHNTWSQYVHQAETYQAKTKSLIPKGEEAPARPTVVNPPPPPKINNSQNIEHEGVSNNPKSSPLMKILKPFQRTEASEEKTTEVQNIQNSTGNRTASTIRNRQTMQPESSLNTSQNITSTTENTVSYEVYQRVLSENRNLREQLTAVTKESEEKIVQFERKTEELQEKILEMVPRADYDALQSEFENSISKAEYQRLKTELTNSVPKSWYDELLNRVSNMVPKEIYLKTERRVIELEASLKDAVPANVIDDLINEISLLGILAELPLSSYPKISDQQSKEAN